MARRKVNPNNRVTLSLPDDVNELLVQISSLTGQPKTAIITELCVENLPMFRALVEAILLAKAGNTNSAYKVVTNMLEAAEITLNQAQLEFEQTKGEIDGKS